MNSIMQRSSRILLIIFVVVSLVGCDQATKKIAQNTLASSDPISFLDGFIRFEYAENVGAFLSLGATLPQHTRFLLFVILSAVAVVGMMIYALRAKRITRTQLFALALLSAGGIGNLIDRTFRGAVVDFVSIGTTSLRTGIFNVADLAVTAGVLILLYDILPWKKSGVGSAESGTEKSA